jgi:hypothetical protein
MKFKNIKIKYITLNKCLKEIENSSKEKFTPTVRTWGCVEE